MSGTKQIVFVDFTSANATSPGESDVEHPRITCNGFCEDDNRHPFLLIDGNPLFSRKGLLREAERIAAELARGRESNVVCLSPGNLHVPLLLGDKCRYVFEHDPVLSEIATDYFSGKQGFSVVKTDGEDFLNNLGSHSVEYSQNQALIWCIGPTGEQMKRIVFDAPFLSADIYVNRVLAKYALWQRKQSEITEQLNRKRININTAKRFGRDWVKNFFRMMKRYAVNPGLGPLVSILDGRGRCIVVGAGGSIDETIESIRTFADDSIIIAVDTITRRLVREGIQPDFVVSADSQALNALHISHSGIDGGKSAIATLPTNHPLTCKPAPEKVLFSSLFFPLVEKLDEMTHQRLELGTGGTVSACAFDLAVLLKPAYILLAGIDFCYSFERPHARGTLFDELWYCKTDYEKPYEHFRTGGMVRSSSFLAADSAGRKVRTDAKFSLFKNWFDSNMKSNVFFLGDRMLADPLFKIFGKERAEETGSAHTAEEMKKIRARIGALFSHPVGNSDGTEEIDGKIREYCAQVLAEATSGERLATRAAEIAGKYEAANTGMMAEADVRFLAVIDRQILSFDLLKGIINLTFQKRLAEMQYVENAAVQGWSKQKGFYRELADEFGVILKYLSLV